MNVTDQKRINEPFLQKPVSQQMLPVEPARAYQRADIFMSRENLTDSPHRLLRKVKIILATHKDTDAVKRLITQCSAGGIGAVAEGCGCFADSASGGLGDIAFFS